MIELILLTLILAALVWIALTLMAMLYQMTPPNAREGNINDIIRKASK